MKKLFVIALSVIAAVALISCSKNNKDEKSDVKFSYELNVVAANGATDQLDIIKTTIVTSDNEGTQVTDEFVDGMDHLTHAVSDIKVPHTETITIKQELKKTGAQLTKDNYLCGINYQLTIQTLNKNGVVDGKIINNEEKAGSFPKNSLETAFPKIYTIKITANAAGEITVE